MWHVHNFMEKTVFCGPRKNACIKLALFCSDRSRVATDQPLKTRGAGIAAYLTWLPVWYMRIQALENTTTHRWRRCEIALKHRQCSALAHAGQRGVRAVHTRKAQQKREFPIPNTSQLPAIPARCRHVINSHSESKTHATPHKRPQPGSTTQMHHCICL